MSSASLTRRAAVEFVGTALLLATVVGSGVMGERLAGGNAALALLANSIATGAALFALISSFGALSGAHFNPLVSLEAASRRALSGRDALGYAFAQCCGAFTGVLVAHLMFDLPLVSLSHHERSGVAQCFSESVATFGLFLTIACAGRARESFVPAAIGCYIAAAYWFTASTSFANPAITFARAFTDTFAGIRLADTVGFVAAQSLGALAASAFVRWLFRFERMELTR